MKLITAFFLICLLGFAGGLFFPWWIIAVVAFIVSVIIPLSPVQAFTIGFLALFLTWGIHASVIDFRNGHLLSIKIASVFSLNGSYIAITVVTALVGGLVGGFASLSGSFLRPSGNKK